MLAKAVTAAEAKALAQRIKTIADDGTFLRLVGRHFHKQHQALVRLADD
jgi:hypothetical protein